MAQWVISKQIAVEAETPEEAAAKVNEGKTISFNVSLRPSSVVTQRPHLPNVPTNMRTGLPVE